jgi:hypothetical protein
MMDGHIQQRQNVATKVTQRRRGLVLPWINHGSHTRPSLLAVFPSPELFAWPVSWGRPRW